MMSQALRDAAPRTVMLLGRSRGQDVMAVAPGIASMHEDIQANGAMTVAEAAIAKLVSA